MSAKRTVTVAERPFAEHSAFDGARRCRISGGNRIGTLLANCISVMKREINRCFIEPMGISDQGSVLMEYVLVQVLVACLLMLVMNEFFYNWGSAKFGPGGMAVKYFYQRLLGGLSLPVP